MASVLKYFFLFFFGGIVYVLIEILWRGYSHWEYVYIGRNMLCTFRTYKQKYTWDIPLLIQMLIGTFIITLMEFIFGCIFNLLLNLNVWDYYDLPFNIMGQICLPYMFLWFLLSPVCIIVDDYIRYLFFNEEKPHYKLFLNHAHKVIHKRQCQKSQQMRYKHTLRTIKHIAVIFHTEYYKYG